MARLSYTVLEANLPEPSLEALRRTGTLALGQVKGEGLVVPSGVLEALD